MHVKRERYTPNDVGPSPLEWATPRLAEISSLITNGFVGTATPYYTDESGVPYLYGTNVRANKLDVKGIRYITRDFHNQQSKTRLRSGDLVTVQSGHIGETAVVPVDLEGANCHALIVTRLHQEDAHPEYLCYYINSDVGKARLRGLEVGSTILHINTKDLKRFRVLLPPLLEQKKIAQILSTWDKAITTTEQLLANSQQQKKALMQQLLTGKKRFPGLSGSWKKEKFGDIFSERVETDNEELPLLSITADGGVVYQDATGRKDTSNNDKSKYRRIRVNDIGYNTMRMWQGRSSLSDKEGIVSPAYTVITPADSVHPEYAAHLFKLPALVHLFYRHSQGLVSDTWNLKFNHLKNISWVFPEYDEQKKIAQSISTCDTQIKVLQKSLNRLKQEKEALMQQLLTGKRRVTIKDATV